MRILLLLALLASLPVAGRLWAQDSDANATLPALGEKLPSADELLVQANKEVADGQLDAAISDATLSMQLNPKNATAYELRGSIYMTKKIWDKAERDYVAADKISPDPAYKYKMAEIHYLKRDFDGARSRFAALKKEETLGDVSIYKVFLCDMFGAHEEQAQRDLAAMDSKRQPPSFIYGQVVWDVYHGKRKEAGEIAAAAAKTLPQATCDLYLGALVSAQRFKPDTASFTTKDGTKYQNAQLFLEWDGLRVLSSKGWVTVPISQLPDDLSSFTNDDLRDQIAQRRLTDSRPAEKPASTVTFTTQSGKTYTNARWTLQDNGLSVLGPNGWIVIPFSDLPSDVSSFPSELQEKLPSRLIRSEQTVASTVERVTFTSKRGRAFDNVRATLTDEGVRVLSNDGWMTVPPRDLPEDLLPFPEPWRERLKELKSLPEISNDTQVLTFTTRAGKRYDDVRCSLESRGVRVIGPDGLVCVTWKDLPDDISMFPSDWRSQIMAGKQAPAAKIP